MFIYSDASGLPGTAVSTRLMQSCTAGNGIDFVITLNPAVVLPEGTYWVSVQSIEDVLQAVGPGAIAVCNPAD